MKYNNWSQGLIQSIRVVVIEVILLLLATIPGSVLLNSTLEPTANFFIFICGLWLPWVFVLCQWGILIRSCSRCCVGDAASWRTGISSPEKNFLFIFLSRFMGTTQIYSLIEQTNANAQHKCTEESKEKWLMKSQKQHGVISTDQDYQGFSNSGSRATLAALIWVISLCSATGWGSNVLWWCCAFGFVPCPNAEHTSLLPNASPAQEASPYFWYPYFQRILTNPQDASLEASGIPS